MTAATRTCTTCANRTPAGTCASPVAAGLRPRFGIVWPPVGHAARCAAFERQQRAAQAEPLRHPYEAERRDCTPASDAEIERMAAVHDRAVALGMTPQQAERVADVQHWGCRAHDDRRPCIVCAHLRAGTSSCWWCAAQKRALPWQCVAELHRCPSHRDAFVD